MECGIQLIFPGCFDITGSNRGIDRLVLENDPVSLAQGSKLVCVSKKASDVMAGSQGHQLCLCAFSLSVLNFQSL